MDSLAKNWKCDEVTRLINCLKKLEIWQGTEEHSKIVLKVKLCLSIKSAQ